jgi:hypothetical protein
MWSHHRAAILGSDNVDTKEMITVQSSLQSITRRRPSCSQHLIIYTSVNGRGEYSWHSLQLLSFFLSDILIMLLLRANINILGDSDIPVVSRPLRFRQANVFELPFPKFILNHSNYPKSFK